MFGMEKLEWCGYPMAKKIWRYVYSFRKNTRTWRTDRRTPRDGIGHNIALRDKNFTPQEGRTCKGKGLDTCYRATYMSQTRDQQRFTISEVAAD